MVVEQAMWNARWLVCVCVCLYFWSHHVSPRISNYVHCAVYTFSVYLCWIGVCYVSMSVANFNDGPINEISVFAVLSTQFPYFGFHFIKLYICIDQSWTLQHTCAVNKRATAREGIGRGRELKASLHFTQRFAKPIRPVRFRFFDISRNCFWYRLFVYLLVLCFCPSLCCCFLLFRQPHETVVYLFTDLF